MARSMPGKLRRVKEPRRRAPKPMRPWWRTMGSMGIFEFRFSIWKLISRLERAVEEVEGVVLHRGGEHVFVRVKVALIAVALSQATVNLGEDFVGGLHGGEGEQFVLRALEDEGG